MTTGSGLFLGLSETNQQRINTVIQQLIEGRSNAVGTFTLTSSSTTTTVTAVACGPNSAIIWSPTTPNAAAAMTTLSCPSTSVAAGSFVLQHANNANNDKTFFFAALG